MKRGTQALRWPEDHAVTSACLWAHVRDRDKVYQDTCFKIKASTEAFRLSGFFPHIHPLQPEVEL